MTIPTIGIGAGPHTDGQVLVWHDFLGLFGDHKYSFVKQFSQGHALFESAIQHYIAEVKQGQFPSLEHSF